MDIETLPTMQEGSEEISECLRAISVNSGVPELRKALGDRLFLIGRYDAALANYRKACERDPGLAGLMSWLDRAEAACRGGARDQVAAMQRELRERHATLLRSAGAAIAGADDFGPAFAAWEKLVLADPCMLRTLDRRITEALDEGDLQRAARYAEVSAGLRLGSRWYPRRQSSGEMVPSFRGTPAMLTIPKLEHDLEQFAYLRERGVLDDEIADRLGMYRSAIARLKAIGPDTSAPLGGDEEREIGAFYNRIVHVHETPRMAAALSDRWDRRAVQLHYRENAPGFVVVDDFLSAPALEALRAFCCASTIWTANVYAEGRLGSFFRTGFNCPLLIQVAEELRLALPDLLHSGNPLRQLWGFKYPPTLSGDTVHADFASVNVNFWITPEAANLDDSSGGMIIFDREAPPDWDFDHYNKRTDLIRAFLKVEGARAIAVRYRENRAIIFNSDLFHETAPVRFRPSYESRRINVTLLYGDRAGARADRG